MGSLALLLAWIVIFHSTVRGFCKTGLFLGHGCWEQISGILIMDNITIRRYIYCVAHHGASQNSNFRSPGWLFRSIGPCPSSFTPHLHDYPDSHLFFSPLAHIHSPECRQKTWQILKTFKRNLAASGSLSSGMWTLARQPFSGGSVTLWKIWRSMMAMETRYESKSMYAVVYYVKLHA